MLLDVGYRTVDVTGKNVDPHLLPMLQDALKQNYGLSNFHVVDQTEMNRILALYDNDDLPNDLKLLGRMSVARTDRDRDVHHMSLQSADRMESEEYEEEFDDPETAEHELRSPFLDDLAVLRQHNAPREPFKVDFSRRRLPAVPPKPSSNVRY